MRILFNIGTVIRRPINRRGALLCVMLLGSSILYAQSIVNGGFTSGTANWGCTPELNPETVYGGSNAANTVAEIDNLVSLCQTVSGFTIGDAYDVTYVASRRLGGCPGPNPAAIGVSIAGLNTTDSRSNTVWAMTPSTFTFTATAATHTLTIVHQFVAYTTCGFIIDDIAITASTPFDVKLAEFEVNENPNGGIDLRWVIAEEWNQAKYVVASSSDGMNWESLGEIASQGDAHAHQTYHLEDRRTRNGRHLYRLQATDKNGGEQLLAIREFVSASNSSPIAFPNPNIGLVSIQHPDIINADFELIDLLGGTRQIAASDLSQDAVRLSLKGVPSGLCMLRIRLRGEIYIQKLWVANGN